MSGEKKTHQTTLTLIKDKCNRCSVPAYACVCAKDHLSKISIETEWMKF